ncbi:hemolysin-type calcium-binding protein [Xanthomonas citri pv. citri]
MNRNVELALLAGASYESSRADINKILVPEGWVSLNIAGWPYGSQRRPETNVPGRVYWQDSTTGFEAAAYVKGSEVVVSFAGTYFEGELKPDMFDNNVPLGGGKLTDQLRQAAEFVVRLKQNPAMAGKSMVLTGHSLGGGLASAIGVMLDVQAVTFDPAPFRAAASMENAQALNAHLERQGLAPDAKLASYTTSGQVPVPVGLALRLLGPAAAGAGTAAGLPSVVMVPVTVAREANVRAIALKGEMLTGEGVDVSVRDAMRIYGSGLDLVENASDASAVALHSQALLTLMLESRDGSADQGFYLAAQRYKPFLGLFSNADLLGIQRTDQPNATLAEHILRHQFGVSQGSPNSAQAVVADKMLDALGKDVGKLGVPNGGFVQHFQEGVLASVLRHYYSATSPDATPDRYEGGALKPLLKSEAGGVSFKVADVEASGGTYRSWGSFVQGILGETQTTIPQLDNRSYAALVRGNVPLSERVAVATSGALNYQSVADDKRDLALGADGADVLNTGAGQDFIFAGRGNDILAGGDGNDTLLGGLGSDTYQFTGGFGRDYVLDQDGLGAIQIDGKTLGDAKSAGKADVWVADLDGQRVGLAVYNDAASTTGKKLVITRAGNVADTITIDNFDLTKAKTDAGYLGIKLESKMRLALSDKAGASPFEDPRFEPQALAGLSTVKDGGGEVMSVHLNRPAQAGDTVTLSLSAMQDQFRFVSAGAVLPVGPAVLNLVEGQTEIVFALMQTGDTATGGAARIEATYKGKSQDDEGTPQQAASNRWDVSLVASAPTQPASNYNLATSAGRDAYDRLTQAQQDVGLRVTGAFQAGGNRHGAAGGAGADMLEGGTAAASSRQWLYGEAGDDVLTVGAPVDLSAAIAAGETQAGSGNDMVAGYDGDDFIDGGAGDDWLDGDYDVVPAAGQQAVETLTIHGAQMVVRNVLEASRHGNDVLDGGAGNDRMRGGGRDDILYGGTGNDEIFGDQDRMNGPETGDDFLDGGEGDDTLVGGGGADVLLGGAGADILEGDDAADQVDAKWHGADRLDGGAGNDSMYGGGGDDVLAGGEGDDWLAAKATTGWPGRTSTRWMRCPRSRATTHWMAGWATTRWWAATATTR